MTCANIITKIYWGGGVIAVLFVLFSMNSISQTPQWIWTSGTIPPPNSYYTPYSTGIGKNISIPPNPYYLRNMKHWPAFLVHSQNPVSGNNITRAIIRIQDKRFEENSDSSDQWAGEPQIQFWSNDYHTPNEWWMGSIQGVSDDNNQNNNIFLGKPNVSGGLAFYSRKKEWPINQGRNFPTETMRIIDDKVTIGAKQTNNKFAVVPWGNYDLADQFAIDYRDGTLPAEALLTKFYKATGNVDGIGKRTSYSWHIELPNINVDQQWETLGALNFCSDNSEVAPGEEGESLPRLVTFLRTGKVGIKNEFPKVELHVLGKASINDPATNETITGIHSDYRLAVEGKLVAKEIIVTESNWNTWPDYVFSANYNLKSLLEVEESIKQNGHLPGIPSAEDIKTNGINVTEVQAKMLEKIEELTLYMIELKKENELLKREINKLK